MNLSSQKFATPFLMTWEESVQWLRNDASKADLVKACYFDDPIEEAANRYHREIEWVKVSELLPSPGKALDVGSGRGISAYALAKDGWDVTALEPDSSAIVGAQAIAELVRRTNTKIKIVSEWGEKLPFQDNSFNLIHARQVLHHAKDLTQFCRELFRVCTPEGKLIATREHVIDCDEDLQVFLRSHPLHHLYGGENAYKLNQYLEALSSAGFIIDQVFSPFESPINYFPESAQDINRHCLTALLGPRLGKKLSFKIPSPLLQYISRNIIKTPGRLYTFVVRKPKFTGVKK